MSTHPPISPVRAGRAAGSTAARGAVLAAAVACCTAALPPQGANLVALTDTTPRVATIGITTAGCKAAACSAKALGVGAAVAARAGGVAWDGRQSRVWVSNGLTLALLDVHGATAACGLACKAVIAPLPGTGTRFVTGMTMVEAGVQSKPGVPGPAGLLFFGYSNQMIGWLPVKGCSLGKPTYCSLLSVLGTQRGIGGLATDDARGHVFVATSSTVSTSPANVIYVLDGNKPCAVVCKFTVAVDQLKCANVRLGPITGIAFDGCADVLYLTDGKTTIYGKVSVSAAGCRFVHGGCCAGAVAERVVGLAVRPADVAVDGRSCTSGRCASCPAMTAGILGDPVLGNGDFAFTLNHAPGNFATAALAVGFAPCTSPGVSLGFCAPVRVALLPFRPLVLFFGNPRPGTSCSGALQLPVAIPITRGICGLAMSVQWVVACPIAGNGVTPCLSMKLQGI